MYTLAIYLQRAESHSKKREILTQVITTEIVNYNSQNVDDERPAKLRSRHKRLLLRERTSY